MRANNPLTQKLFLISWYIILLFWEFIFPLSCAEIMPSKHGIIVDNTLNGMKRLEKDSCKTNGTGIGLTNLAKLLWEG